MHDDDGLLAAPEAAASSRFKQRLGLYALCAFAVAGLIVLFELRHPFEILAMISAGRASLHALVSTLGFWAPVLFVLAYAGLMVLIWVPSWPCSMMGGFLFGTAAGTVYSLIGATLGAVAAFALARSGLAQRISQRNPLFRRLQVGFQRDALEYVVALRLLPVMPFGIIHVAAAVFGVPLGIFTLGTILGMIPCVLIYAALGADVDRIAAAGGRIDAATLTDSRVLVPLFALAALALVPVAIRRIREWCGR
jgi:uncharacterized membrane protein YdjX (TVP38/TMEM64 family)